MNIILSTLSMLGVLIISSGLYIFHNIFIEIMPFSFKNKFKESCFFFFAYLGLCIFTISWGVIYYLFYLYFDLIFSLNFSLCLFSFIFILFGVFAFGVFFIDAINYQFMLATYWNDSELFFFISKIFSVAFFFCSVLLNFYLFFFIFSYIYIDPIFFVLFLFFNIVYSFWLISFFYNFVFKKSFFLI